MSENQSTGDYVVGYGNPPQHSKWKKGTSGNPKGRPKGSKNLKTILREELAEMVEVREGNRTRKVSKQKALVKSLVARAINGSDAAAAKLLDLLVKAFGLGDEAGDADGSLTAEEREILASFKARFLRNGGTEHEPPAGPDEEGKP